MYPLQRVYQIPDNEAEPVAMSTDKLSDYSVSEWDSRSK